MTIKEQIMEQKRRIARIRKDLTGRLALADSSDGYRQVTRALLEALWVAEFDLPNDEVMEAFLSGVEEMLGL